MFKSSELYLAVAIVLLLVLTIVPELPAWQDPASQEDKSRRAGADSTGRSASAIATNIETELIPSVAIDFRNNVITVKLGDVVLNEYAFTPVDDSESVMNFAEDDDRERRVTEWIDRVHLYRAAALIDDNKLAVISDAVKSKTQDIQRYIPAEMVLHFSGGRRLTVKSETEGKALSKKKNALWRVTEFFGSLFGGRCLEISMKPQDAMSLYGLCRRGPEITIQQDPDEPREKLVTTGK